MTRDRLQELLNLSRLPNNPTSESHSINIKNEYSSIDDILGEYVEIRKNIAQLAQNLDTMRKSLRITDLKDFNSSKVEALNDQNVSIGQKLLTKFRELRQTLPEDEDFTLEARMKRTLFHGMHQEYINVWTSQEEFLQTYEAKLKKKLMLHSKIMNTVQSEEEVEELLANKTTSLFVNNILEETEKERRLLRDLYQRHTELQKLENSIKEVHSLFIRIQNLVLEQNDRIQMVEFHAQQASVHVDKGAVELDKAHTLKKRGLKCKMCIIMWSIVILTILLVIAVIF
ncbi:unnamed protein product [Hermetia illucens]|uniref:t-SNARE coiled-coil homology domain-containing protein n=1 Tax=Hermetia illucens TaxID=343691 RepID=A0A7R8V173_HERIL|nr:syntaxin-4 [Hermetia illucens]XP_037920885.1 syntaxin-4 [Hermetia illucens]CAD7091006.1 unnamed protein product [Hermetia illucens]